MKARTWLTMALSAGAALADAPVEAQDVASFYGGRTVTVVVGSSTGGGIDGYGRLIARHLGKHIPGNPKVIVQNLPGAGSLTAARTLYTAAPKDGTQIAIVASSALFDPLMKGDDLKAYDPSKFNFLGNANADTSVCVVRRDASVKSYADIFERELVVGGSGPGSALFDFPLMHRNLLGAKMKLVAGYPGSTEIKLAVERNEVQGACGQTWSSTKQHYPEVEREDGYVKVLVQEDVQSSPILQKLGVPLLVDFTKNPEQKRALEAYLATGSISRPFLLPPGVPADRIEALRRAFMATMKDPELQAEAAKQRMDIDARTGEEVQKLVEKLYSTSPELLAVLRKAADSGR
jgi:tripartite-type tricarboxylate transporter receptor subunit TctC